MIIVNGFQPLTIITKRSILDVAAAVNPPLISTATITQLYCIFIKEFRHFMMFWEVAVD